MDIPPSLLRDIREGRAVLVLGAGASVGAQRPTGDGAPIATELGRIIAEQFLGTGFASQSLAVVAELAASETDVVTVQEFLRPLFADLRPAAFHQIPPTFRWRGLATTNFDLVVEQSYAAVPNRAQQLVPLISDEDRVDELLHSPDAVAYLKLHGCVNHSTDAALPWILSPEQYLTHRRGRSRLFNMLEEWGYEHPLIFVGQQLADMDLRALILGLTEQVKSRPRYYLILPDASEPVRRFWDSKRISVLSGTYEQFLRTIDASIPSSFRGLQLEQAHDNPITRRLTVSPSALSKEAFEFLDIDVEYVDAGIRDKVDALPVDFYRGATGAWSPIEQELDVRRRLVDTMLSEVVLPEDTDRPAQVELVVTLAEAGAGKSVLLRRVAWEASRELEKLCLYMREGGVIDERYLSEIHLATRERIFLFVDNAAENTSAILQLLSRSRRQNMPLTVITAERGNEWNMHCEGLDEYVTAKYSLPYLSHGEVEDLLNRLERHHSLGRLADLSNEQRIEELEARAGRQLLVALHEATLGRRFEDILVDEFSGLEPLDAQQLYLSVCALNRLGVPLRAGTVARVHDISFAEFRDRLFKPLEHVVETRYDARLRDMLYEARHQLIADIVFRRILTDPIERFRLYTRLLNGLNLMFSTDVDAFRRMIRARSLMELFPSYDDVRALYSLAMEVAPNDAYVMQQMAIYEMNRPNGNLQTASVLLDRARRISPRDTSIVHSQAELARRRGETANNQVTREHYLGEARRLANSIKEDGGAAAYHTLLATSVDRLRDILAKPGASGLEIQEAINGAERDLETALQRYPSDPQLLGDEAQLGMVLHDEDRAVRALQEAFRLNRRSPFIANRLAKAYASRGELTTAKETLERALEANPGEQRLHYGYVTLIMFDPEISVDTKLYHLRRGFSDGDKNYDAQFWYAVWLYVKGSADALEDVKAVFSSLRNVPLPHERRTEVRWTWDRIWNGTVMRLETTYGFVRRDGVGDWVFMHSERLGQAWTPLRRGERIAFRIGFQFGGPVVEALTGS